ncbi:MAG: NADH-quinone oxidoreductase subunit N [Alicyclobacillus macrosporangiidus]|uniref:NADH-quinone oxidoreductase subunit N n=1 Tax=Alicyclobacillus macrosporangiidus TaxID=392015 RepID=UPI0026EF0617|nr:NADH-quinone oxidoreductase subunit N [Alicyclobacillus macrosporangiidus]MCL6599366.1 NADH-quinone oxidoreductase subunit N [Alicyclobacillus macrosporangiidus]
MPTTDMLHQPYGSTMGPMIIVTAAAFVVMILEFLLRKGDRRWLAGLSLVGIAAALVAALWNFHHEPAIALNTVVVDAFGSVFSVLILISALFVLLFTLDYTGRTKVASEHTYLILFAVVGALAMATAVDLVTLYVGLELLSVASYVLVALRRHSARSVEGGVKYLLMGSVGSAVLLYGMSFVYGISGTTNLIELGSNGFAMYNNYPAITVLAFLLMLAGMGFKLSLVPFHMWTPDAYDGAPSPISAFLATLSKAAAFGMLLRMLLFAFNAAATQLFWWAGVLAAVTMVVGNLIALPQRNMKRLLAFSSVAQAGYVLVPFALIQTNHFNDWPGLFDSISFYLYAYTFMTIGAFAVVYVVSRARNTIDSDALIGLYQRSPWLAAALTVFVLGLAGMPLTGGFIGKFYIFTDTVHLHRAWLGVLLFLTSVASFYYYLGWVRKIFQREPVGDIEPIRASGTMNVLVGLCVLGTIVLGVVPAVLLHPLLNSGWLY